MSWGRWGRIACALGVLAAGVGGAAAAQAAFDAAPGVSIAAFATGFPATDTGVGPLGLAFSPHGTLYVSDRANGHIYEFGSSGGVAGPSTQLGSTTLNSAHGLAFGPDGRLYVAATGDGAIVEVDPADGTVRRTITKGVPCPTGLAVDPASGDLFATSLSCSGTVWRISAPASANPSVSAYATQSAAFDGITFGPDGTLWAVDSTPGTATNIVRVAGTGSSTPGAAARVANVPGADGIAVDAVSSALVVNGTDGNITKIDLASGTPSYSPVMTNGTRGDLAAVGPDHALYATQTDRVLKVTASPQALGNLAPTNPKSTSPVRAVGADVIRLPAAKRCISRRLLRIRIVPRRGLRYTSATVTVNGRRVMNVGRRALARPILLRRLPSGHVRVTVVVRTSSGRRLTMTRRYVTCAAKR
jgi:sugar lactone lactonase YvrE